MSKYQKTLHYAVYASQGHSSTGIIRTEGQRVISLSPCPPAAAGCQTEAALPDRGSHSPTKRPIKIRSEQLPASVHF